MVIYPPDLGEITLAWVKSGVVKSKKKRNGASGF